MAAERLQVAVFRRHNPRHSSDITIKCRAPNHWDAVPPLRDVCVNQHPISSNAAYEPWSFGDPTQASLGFLQLEDGTNAAEEPCQRVLIGSDANGDNMINRLLEMLKNRLVHRAP